MQRGAFGGVEPVGAFDGRLALVLPGFHASIILKEEVVSLASVGCTDFANRGRVPESAISGVSGGM